MWRLALEVYLQLFPPSTKAAAKGLRYVSATMCKKGHSFRSP